MKIETIEIADSIHGSIFVPLHDSVMSPQIQKYGIWEEVECFLFRNKIYNGMNVINIGANFGYHALTLSKIVGKTGKVLAIEPNSDLIPLLEKNMHKSKYNNYEILNEAIGGDAPYVYLYKNEWNFGDSRIFDPLNFGSTVPNEHKGISSSNRIRVKNSSLLNVSRRYLRKPDFILSDAQGMDVHILIESYSLISKFKPILLFEFVPNWAFQLKHNFKQLFDLLNHDNYLIFELTDNGLKPITEISLLKENYGISSWFSNILCIQKDKM